MSEVKTLSQICRDLDISRKVVQGYEKHGLVRPCGKDKNGHLIYDDKSISRITRIRFLQNLGFSLKEIEGIVDKEDEDILTELNNKSKQTQSEIDELEKRKETLDSLIRSIETKTLGGKAK